MFFHRNLQFFRFVVIGGFSYGLSLLFLIFLIEILALPYLVATALVFFGINGLSFFMNKRYTFLLTGSLFQTELLRYYGIMLLSLILNLAGMYMLVGILQFSIVVASIIVSGVLLFFNYFFHKNFTFRTK